MFVKNWTAKILTLKNNLIITDKCIVAESFVTRFKGLMGRPAIASDEGIFFPRCNSVHMWFMRTPIDIIFVARDGSNRNESEKGKENFYRVTSVRKKIRPWAVFPATDFKATDTLELAPGAIQRFGVEAGDRLCIS